MDRQEQPIIEEYPHNLLTAIRGKTCLEMPAALTADVQAGIRYALSTLEEQERALLQRRYADGKSLEEAAEWIAVSEEAAQQMEEKALGKLRRQAKWSYIQYGVANYMRHRIAEEHYKARQAGFWEGYRKGVEDARSGVPDVQVGEEILDMPIEALHLSVHALSCLRGAHCTRVRDVAQIGQAEPIRIRNLGIKTAAEIAKVLKEAGITQTAWDQYLA